MRRRPNGELNEQLRQATSQVAALQASLELARKRVAQNTELTAAGAGNRFDLEQAQTNVNELTAQIAAARAAEQQVREKLSGRVKGDLAAVAAAKAQIATAQAQVLVARAQADTTRAKLENARWNLEQTTVVAPSNGTMVNVQLRPGYFVSGVAFNEVMTFVDNEYQVFAMFNQNELHQVVAGNEAEITLDTLSGADRQGACGFGDLGAGAGGDRSVRQPATDDVHLTSGQVPGEVGCRRARQRALPGGGRPRRGRDLHGTPDAHSPHSKSADQDVVVSRLHHHQAQYQSPLKDGTMARSRSTARRRLRSIAAIVATGLVATMAGCALKKPPDAAAIKEQALPALQTPAQWTAAGAGAGTVSDNWLASFHDDQLAAAVDRSHRAQRRSARRAPRGSNRRCSMPSWRGRSCTRRSMSSRMAAASCPGTARASRASSLSATWEIDLWGRVRYGRAASAAQAASAEADFEYARQSIAALVAKSWFLAIEAGLQVEAARETIRASEELVRLAGDRARIGVGNQEDVFVARASVGTYRDVLRQLELGREQAIRALEILLGRYPAAAAAPSPQLPGFPARFPAGLPSALLERRPDVIAAERRVAVAFNRIR